MSGNKQWFFFQWLIYKYYLQLSFVTAFSFPWNTKYRRQVVAPEYWSMTLWMAIIMYVLRTYGCGVEGGKIALNLRWIPYWLATSYAGYMSGGEGPKMITNQYFNVYALRRVRCTGYATGYWYNLTTYLIWPYPYLNCQWMKGSLYNSEGLLW